MSILASHTSAARTASYAPRFTAYIRAVKRTATMAVFVLLAVAIGFGLAWVIPVDEAAPPTNKVTITGSSTIPPPEILAEVDADHVEPTTVAGATAPLDHRRLRGIPAVGRNVTGAVFGSDPLKALLAKERRRERGR